ncbi:MAG TPA: hypothetical protein VEF72_25260 [Mycobacterium sp.]|jgi:GGDEF domain-containing protein|nr:hypothetical protein [Mycobacterium sp.]
MTDPAERIRQAVVERIRKIVDGHHASSDGDDGQMACSCGAKGLSDHPRHVAEQIVDGLDLKAEAAEAADHVKKEIRYATAWFDWELTQLEGAQC